MLVSREPGSNVAHEGCHRSDNDDDDDDDDDLLSHDDDAE